MMAYRTSSTDEHVRAWDPIGHALNTVDNEHRMCHEGTAFISSNIVTGLADAGVSRTLWVTGAKSVHVRACELAVSASPVTIEWFEGTTVSANGTALSAYSVNRILDLTPTLSLFLNPTVTVEGTQIASIYVPSAGGSGTNKVGALATEMHEEIILRPNTKYLAKLTNTSGSSITIGCRKFWYEIPDHFST